MTTSERVKKRIDNLLSERGMSVYRLGLEAGILPGTLSGVMHLKSKSVGLNLLIKIAHGFGMEVWEFLDDPLFAEENLQI